MSSALTLTSTDPRHTLRELREHLGLSIQDVATRARTTVSWLTKVEAGHQTVSTPFIGRVTAAITDLAKIH